MAKKSPPLLPSTSLSEEEEASSDEEQPPATSKPEPQNPTKNNDDEDEDEESEDESTEESDDDEEEPGSDNRKPKPSAAASAASKPASESASGSESEDDSDSEAATAKLVTPICSRPMADGPVLKETGDGEKPNGKPLFQRIWTPEDEIAILSAMAGFQLLHGPIKMTLNTIGDFLEFVKDSLSIGVSGTQLVDKIRRLKKKYSVVAARAKNNGKELKFPTTHDLAVYELSKKVWGKEVGVDEREMVANGENGVATNGGGKRGYPLLKEAVAEIEKKTGNRLVAEALEMIESEKASVLEKKLKKQRMVEIKHSMHELDLLKETLKLIMAGAERAMN